MKVVCACWTDDDDVCACMCAVVCASACACVRHITRRSGYVEPAPVPFTTKGASFTLQNKYAAVTFSSTTGTMLGVTNLGSGVAMDLREDIATYVNGTGAVSVAV